MPLIVIFGLITFVAVVLSAFAEDALFAFHMALIAVIAGVAAIWRMRTIDYSKTAAIPLNPLPAGYMDDVVRAGVIATVFWGIAGFLVGVYIALAARLPRAQPRPALDHVRPAPPAAHLGGDLRLRRQCADHDVVLRRPAHHRRTAMGRQPRLVRLLGLPGLHRARRDRLPRRHHPVARIRRAGMVRRPLADHRLGRLSRRLPRHAPQAQGAAHLRRQLVLPRLHRHHRDAARGQQPGDPRLARSARRATRSSPASRMR